MVEVGGSNPPGPTKKPLKFNVLWSFKNLNNIKLAIS